MNFGNLLEFPRDPTRSAACLLVVVQKARMGDTFEGNFRYYDMRADSTTNWSTFHQVAGRAYGYGARPIMLMSQSSAGIMKNPESAKTRDGALKRTRQRSPADREAEEWCSHFRIRDVPITDLVDLGWDDALEVLSKLEVMIWNRVAWMKGQPALINLNCSETTPQWRTIFYVTDGLFYDMVLDDGPDGDYLPFFEPDWLPLGFELDPLETLAQRWQLSPTHAANDEEIMETFSRGFYLAAEPQMGKTGAMLSLILEIARNYPLQVSTLPGDYPGTSTMIRLCKAVPPDFSYSVGKYGVVRLALEAPKGYVNLAPPPTSPPRCHVIQRLDYSELRGPPSVTQATPSPEFAITGNLTGEKAPLIFISSGRAGHANLNWNPPDGRQQVLIVPESDMTTYLAHYETTHSIFHVPDSFSVGRTRARYCNGLPNRKSHGYGCSMTICNRLPSETSENNR